MMFEFAYSSICEELPAGALPSPRQKLSDAIELIAASDRACSASHVRMQLLSDFRWLWLSILNDLIPPGHEHPAEPQGHMQAALNGVLQEIERRRFGKPCTNPWTAPEVLQ